MVKKYGNEELNNEWNDYEIRMSEYILSNHSIYEIERNFNSISKWFG